MVKNADGGSTSGGEPGCGCGDSAEAEVKTAGAVESTGGNTSECCGPACGCQQKPTHTRAKAVVSLLVLAAVAVILAVKMTGGPGSAAPVDDKAAAETNSAQVGQPAPVSLPSFAELNSFAVDKDAVLVVIPARGGAAHGQAIDQAVAGAKQKLEANGVNVGVFSLQTRSPDYAGIPAQQPLPGVLVISRTRPDLQGQRSIPGAFVVSKEALSGMVTGSISESRLLQAYVASARASSGGGCGCNKGGSGASTCGGGQ